MSEEVRKQKHVRLWQIFTFLTSRMADDFEPDRELAGRHHLLDGVDGEAGAAAGLLLLVVVVVTVPGGGRDPLPADEAGGGELDGAVAGGVEDQAPVEGHHGHGVVRRLLPDGEVDAEADLLEGGRVGEKVCHGLKVSFWLKKRDAVRLTVTKVGAPGLGHRQASSRELNHTVTAN